jgi:iron complex outermembrane recepter protein
MKAILSMTRVVALAKVLALVGSAALAQAAEPPETKQIFNIQPQSTEKALTEFGLTTGLQILFSTRIAAAQRSPAVVGKLSAQEALERLLLGTNLKAEFVNEKTVTIRDGGKEAKISREEGEREDGIWTAQATTVTTKSGTGETQSNERESDESKDEALQLEQIVVTGTHIRGADHAIASVIVLDKRDIDASGVSTVSALVEKLPQNFASLNPGAVGSLVGPGSVDGGRQGSSLNLRGIGDGTTLALLNGRRMALGFASTAGDISAIPLPAIKRVEILADGASAVYGSDAVGGVVNFVLQDDFDGAETQLGTSWASGGVNEYRANQILGTKWDSGGALISATYFHRDMLVASERDFIPSISGVGSLYPQDETSSILMSGHHAATDRVGVFADALYTNRRSSNESGLLAVNQSYTVDNPQLNLAVGTTWNAPAGWEIELSGGYASNDTDILSSSTDGAFVIEDHFEINTARLKGDGALRQLPGGPLRAAVGIEWREESLALKLRDQATADTFQSLDHSQGVRSVFAEIYLPIVGMPSELTGVRRLDVSLAGRLDDYSAFGSSFDPRIGVAWQPAMGLTFRGIFGTSYVAPRISDYSTGNNSAFAYYGPDPGASGGVSRILSVAGTAPGLFPQESTNWTFGLELSPESFRDLKVALNYYDIRYEHRIANPGLDTDILANEAGFGGLSTRSPSVEQVLQAIAAGELGQGFIAFTPDFDIDSNFNPATVNVIVDRRRRNLSQTDTSGLDLSIEYGTAVRDGYLSFAIDGTYILELKQLITSSSDPVDSVDTIYDPTRWRARASIAWQYVGWTTNVSVNYKDAYVDNRILSSPRSIASYTTTDLRVAYDFEKSGRVGSLEGLQAALSIQNLLDEDPPPVEALFPGDLGFDFTNANPMGRFVGLDVRKRW